MISEFGAFPIYIYIFGHVLCRILVPQPGIEHTPPALEAQILNHWATREVPGTFP